MESFATIAGAVGLSVVVAWLLNRMQQRRDNERVDHEDEYTWHARWEAEVKKREALAVETAEKVAAVKKESDEAIASQARTIARHERRITALEKQVRALGEVPVNGTG